MKYLFFVFMCIVIKSNAQSCGLAGDCDKPLVTANVQFDNSFKYYQPSGFSGIGVHAGIWVGNLGFTVGWTDTRRDYSVYARRDFSVSIMQRIFLFEEHIQMMPFFTAGTNSYADLGLRIGYKVHDGLYVGGMTSINMKYGLNVSISVNH